MSRLCAFSATVLLVAGCAAIPEEERILLVEEIDCSRAEDRILALEAAKPTTAREARILASSLLPAGIALGVATGDIRNRERVLSGEYATDIDTRIALIRETCGLPTPAG